MEENLKTRTVSFKNVFIDEDKDLSVLPDERRDSLTTHQINTLKINLETSAEVNDPVNFPELEEKKVKRSKLQDTNIYYSYIPKFYLKELSYAKILTIIFGVLFAAIFITGAVLMSLSFTVWQGHINPYIFLLLLIPLAFFLTKFIIAVNRFKNFNNEAMMINFRDEKVLSNNIQRICRKLKTNYIDVNWFCAGAYVILLLIMLVDAILPMIIYHAPFADFNTPITVDGQYTYFVLFWTSVGVLVFTLLSHIWIVVSSYLRVSNIENFYNYMVIDPNEIAAIKKSKMKRDAVIFFAVILTIAFIIWLVVRLVKRNQQTKVVVK